MAASQAHLTLTLTRTLTRALTRTLTRTVTLNAQAHLDAIETLIQMETNLKRSCSHCRGFKEGLTRCSRCKAAYYCGSECQMAHWKAGHAQDCCDSGPDCSHLLAMAMGTTSQ